MIYSFLVPQKNCPSKQRFVQGSGHPTTLHLCCQVKRQKVKTYWSMPMLPIWAQRRPNRFTCSLSTSLHWCRSINSHFEWPQLDLYLSLRPALSQPRDRGGLVSTLQNLEGYTCKGASPWKNFVKILNEKRTETEQKWRNCWKQEKSQIHVQLSSRLTILELHDDTSW